MIDFGLLAKRLKGLLPDIFTFRNYARTKDKIRMSRGVKIFGCFLCEAVNCDNWVNF